MRNAIGLVLLATIALLLFRVVPPALTAIQTAPDALGTSEHAAELSAPAAAARPNAPGVAPLRVLFVGNSHTYANDLPHLVAQLAAAAKQPRALEVSVVVAGGATLADHLAGDAVRTKLSEARWDYVVLQEQQQRPTYTFDSKRLESEFFAPARTLDVLIHAASSKTVLFMTAARRDGDKPFLPDDSYEKMQERGRDSFMRLGAELDATVAPVGVAWRWVHDRRPDLPLWADDGYHPALAGSYLGACVFYTVLYGAPVLDNPFTAGLPPADASLLQFAADTARFL